MDIWRTAFPSGVRKELVVVAPPLVVIGNDDDDDDGVDGDDCLGLVMMGSVVASSWDVM